VRKLSQPVEFRLLEREVRELDMEIDHAQQTLNWESDGILHLHKKQLLSSKHFFTSRKNVNADILCMRIKGRIFQVFGSS